MNRKLLVLYGLYLGWMEILINQILSANRINVEGVTIISILIIFVIFGIFKSSLVVEQSRIVHVMLIGILTTMGYFYVYNYIPVWVVYLLYIGFMISLTFIVINIFASFKYCGRDYLTMTESVKIATVLFFVNTLITLVYKMLEACGNVFVLNIGVFIITLIILVYCLYTLIVQDNYLEANIEKEKGNERNEIRVRMLLVVSVSLMLLSAGYGPYLGSIRVKLNSIMTYDYIILRLVYLASLIVTYRLIVIFKGYLEILFMSGAAVILMGHLFIGYVFSTAETVILILLMQFFYGMIHALLGGLVIMVGYLYRDTLKNMAILFAGALIPLCIGILVPDITLGNTSLNVFFTLVTTIVVMMIIMVMPKNVFQIFEQDIESIKHKLEEGEMIKKIGGYDLLTNREKEVANYLVQKYTNKEIADMMGISENTLKKHAKNVYEKLEVANKRELRYKANII